MFTVKKHKLGTAFCPSEIYDLEQIYKCNFFFTFVFYLLVDNILNIIINVRVIKKTRFKTAL